MSYPANRNFLSTRDDAADAAAHIAWMAEICPATRIVLGGFSQGASVTSMLAGAPPVGDRIGAIGPAPPLAPKLARNAAAVVVFGNPGLRFGNPGLRFGNPLSTTGQFAGRAIELCSQGDPICS